MQFDVTALESATLVFFGTMLIALTLAAFVLAVAFVALVLLGIGAGIWNIMLFAVKALVHGINHAWNRLVHHTSNVDLSASLQGQPTSGRGNYRRVA